MRNFQPKVPLLLILIFVSMSISPQDGATQTLSISALVAEPAGSVTRLVSFAEEHGGYFLTTTFQRVILRLPMAEIASFRTFLEEEALEILNYQQISRDVTQEKAEALAALSARREILERNLEFLDRADVNGTLAIEREVTYLLNEIEAISGRILTYDVDTKYALVTVQLAFQGTTLPPSGGSSFGWINTVDPYSFIGGSY